MTAACVAIDKIIASVREATNITSDISFISNDISRLDEIKGIISLPSKYDTIVVYLQPFLSTGHLEDANNSCLQEKDCMQCGFHWLWSNGLWKTLFCEEISPSNNTDGTSYGETNSDDDSSFNGPVNGQSSGTANGKTNGNDDGTVDGSSNGQSDGSSNYPSNNNNENITTRMNTLRHLLIQSGQRYLSTGVTTCTKPR